MKTTLDKLKKGEGAIVKKINTKKDIKRRLLDIGFTDETKIECVLISPSGNPKAYYVRGALIAIREEDAKLIEVEI